MQQQLTQLRTTWGGIPSRAQLAILGVAVVTVVVMFLVIRAATSTEWVAVTDPGLSADKQGQAQAAIEEAGFDVRSASTGGVLEVPKESASKAAAVVMAAGIRAKGGRADCAKQFSEGGGFIAQTSKQTEIKLETCQESQAANDIENIEGISRASVDVTLPPKGLFQDEAEVAKASVMVGTDGARLSDKVVRGIQQSVSGRFEGLTPEAVSIIDESGASLAGSEEDASQTADKLATESRLNAAIEQKLTQQLTQYVGEGKVVVTSNAELDMDAIERVVRDVGGEDNLQGPAEEASSEKELLDGPGGTAVQGVAGTGTNLGGATATTPATDPDNRTGELDGAGADTGGTTADGEKYLKDISKEVYANDKIEEAITVAPGTVIRNRIAVVVDDTVDAAAANAVKNTVMAYMGGNPEDSFAFDQAPLAAAVAADGTDVPSMTSAIAGYVKWVLMGLALIGLAFVMRRSLTQRTAELLAPADDLLLLEPGEFSPIPIADLEAALAAGQPDPMRTERLELQRRIETIAEQKPVDVANELRRWMHQDEQMYAQGRKAS